MAEQGRTMQRSSKVLQELLEHPGWKELVTIAEEQIKVRLNILQMPLDSLPEGYKSMDFQSRAMALETVKGAIIGIRLVLGTPLGIIETAKAISAQKADPQGDSK